MKQSKPILIETMNYITIHNCCNDALNNNKNNIIIGEPGSGKTTALLNFSERNASNVRIIRSELNITEKQLLISIIENLGITDVDSKANIHTLIVTIASYFNQRNENFLLIIDDADKLKPKAFVYFSEIREVSGEKLGIIYSGVNSLQQNLEKWNRIEITGIPEFFGRIDSWSNLYAPTAQEIRDLVRAYNIKDKKFENSLKGMKSFRELVNKIKNYLIFLKKKS